MKIKSLIVLFSLVLTFIPVQSQAQEDADIIQTSMRDFGIVGGCTALGALLGASTLSFVEEPGDHLKNILVGGAVGVIAGVAIVAYMQANKSKEVYQGAELEFQPAPEFSSRERLAWHKRVHENLSFKESSNQMVNYQFDF